MSFSHGMRPSLVVRESRLYQGVSLLVLLAFGSGMLFFVVEEADKTRVESVSEDASEAPAGFGRASCTSP